MRQACHHKIHKQCTLCSLCFQHRKDEFPRSHIFSKEGTLLSVNAVSTCVQTMVYECQHLGFLTCALMLMHANVQGVDEREGLEGGGVGGGGLCADTERVH